MDLWTNERLLNMVEQIIGPDVAGHPVWNLRVKPPVKPPKDDPMTVPWHQGKQPVKPQRKDNTCSGVTVWKGQPVQKGRLCLLFIYFHLLLS